MNEQNIFYLIFYFPHFFKLLQALVSFSKAGGEGQNLHTSLHSIDLTQTKELKEEWDSTLHCVCSLSL